MFFDSSVLDSNIVQLSIGSKEKLGSEMSTGKQDVGRHNTESSRKVSRTFQTSTVTASYCSNLALLKFNGPTTLPLQRKVQSKYSTNMCLKKNNAGMPPMGMDLKA